MIEDSIFKSGVLEYVTIVWTKFSKFRNKGECELDMKRMREENKLVAEIVDSCNGTSTLGNLNELGNTASTREKNRFFLWNQNMFGEGIAIAGFNRVS
ncbi:hypothetical protein RhiirA5_431073 [Rhizophagus irregularis]|uniref:Uncharacterized protein n=1 Tax=Rhizophagus irregularis TaxID=588596 RepID=A0A2I1FB79_9GLOM|nr:hypothetical protein RhiirA5_431073 [Rhizophagus irregularis]PKC56442.1 hypothetical protein RhiirA1_473994 [Rhizophagus irregularis]PKY31613.1 hypothetical protein RhiirB3_449304 [Rhizophagus irregularis]